MSSVGKLSSGASDVRSKWMFSKTLMRLLITFDEFRSSPLAECCLLKRVGNPFNSLGVFQLSMGLYYANNMVSIDGPCK